MGYAGGRLAQLGEAGEEPMFSAAYRTTERVAQLLQRLVKHYTPVAEPPPGAAAEWVAARGRMPGTLRESWQVGQIRVNYRAGDVYSIEVYTLDPVAPHVEYPTMPHLIYPRGWSSRLGGGHDQPMLRWWDRAGGLHFGWVVHHPGTQGSFMMAKALADLEVQWQEIGAEELARWADETRARI